MNSLPQPKTTRWQPLRCGILNLFRYDDEVFPFEDGHLLLRGSNGSGKSRVLALTLPFLFDGELDPVRMEPDRDRNKRVEWNLLMNKHQERSGYTWLELGRLDEDGPQYLTLGCGLNAVAGRGRVERWFFICERRVGEDLELKTPSGVVLNQRRLAETLAQSGEVISRSQQYRRAVNNRLFQLNDQRYRALINLLIELRQPQLSRKFEEDKLSKALSEALPPLTEKILLDVADAFRGLDQERDDLEKLQLAKESTTRFLKTYDRYAQVAARRRAEKVRASHSSYEESQRKHRVKEQTRQEAEQALTAAVQQLQHLEQGEEEVRARIETLKDSPEMRQAQDMDRAAKLAERILESKTRAGSDLERAQQRETEQQRRQQQSRENAEESRTELEETLKSCGERAATCALDQVYERVASSLGLPDHGEDKALEQCFRQLDEALAKRREDLQHLESRNREVKVAAEELSRARERHNELEAQRDEASEQCQQAQKAKERQATALMTAFKQWLATLTELNSERFQELDEPLQLWCESGHDQSPLETTLRHARDEAVEAFTEQKERLKLQREETRVARDNARELCEQLREGYHEPPVAPVYRDESTRAEREGAPLWRLIDFKESVPDEERAGLEAALEASGLLDAWVLPDGELWAADTQDSLLTAHGDELGGPNISDVLVPAIDGEDPKARLITTETIAALLQRIGLGAGADQWVDVTGNWQLGPLQGAWSKTEASHIGASAREAARKRRLQAAEADLATLETRLAQLEKELDELAARRQQLEAEVAALPDHEPIRACFSALSAAHAHFNSLTARVVEAEQILANCQGLWEKARHLRDEDARALGLFEFVDKPQRLSEALTAFGHHLSLLRSRVKQHGNHLKSLRQNEADLDEAVKERERRAAELDRYAREYVEARSRFETLRATHGKSVQEVHEQLAEAEKRNERIRAEIKDNYRQQSDLKSELVKTETELRQLETEQEEMVVERSTHIESLREFTAARMLVVAIPDMDVDGAMEWSVAHGVRIARDIEARLQEVKADDGAWQRLDGRIHQTINELIDELRPRDYEPRQTKMGDLMLVTVPLQGRDWTMSELDANLQEQIHDRRELLGTREREILEKYLIGEVTQVLHELLHECEDLVTRMNKELMNRPTSSGLTLKFKWSLHKDVSPVLAAARRLLMRSDATWTADERKTLGRFLQQRIEEARRNEELGNWYDHLRAALDYRQWHQFRFEINSGDGWKPLSRRTHGEKSGGEKVTALMLLQLAAAAAHYESAAAHAPRFILLDEAFVGVDDQMRAQCMGLFATFDLDFIMTSEREKGCYETLPGVSICQLSAHPGLDAIFVNRMYWNGKQLIKREASA